MIDNNICHTKNKHLQVATTTYSSSVIPSFQIPNTPPPPPQDMKRAEVAIIATPTMGNLLPTIEFATHLTNHPNHHISVTILTISMPQWPLIHNYLQSHTSTDLIRFIHLPPPDTPPPNHYTSIIEYLSLYIQNHKPIVQQTIESLSVPLDGFFVDMFCTSMIDVANDLNIPCYLYFASPAAYLSFVLHLTTLPVDSVNQEAEERQLIVPGFQNPVPSTAFPLFCINKKERGYSWFVRHALRYKETKGIVVNTFRELEPYALDSLCSNNSLPPVYPIGPVVDHVGPVKWHPNRSMHEKVIRWFDRQPDFSVVFLCFGSMGSLNRAQVREIATGLERTGYRFLWSLREPGKTKIELPNDYEKLEEDLFPDGFIDRTAEIGLVCGWVSQVSVLAHKAIGGFVSHCGWNSILESISYGVPIATWPLYGEQHLNAFEMVKEVGLSVEIRLGKGGDLVLADEVEKGVRELMDSGDGELRKKVQEMSEMSKMALLRNGSSFQALETLMGNLLSKV
ncbi:putative UDP-glucuronosyl/UDP-glucosyltransferase, UDP-glycosyltransferase family [Helianthus annuus]|uniref:Glycosyltransferase n=2 Tax=Helianthus annuus TaxID=4232 RepID=A0A9K3E8D1_HELAN|nr:putative UDP-glucuronosyl/UDP-glucosyltransferase, UDP-glycosyltransferase family [Helianthus annuus]KAJ0659655.1 putative UDP-glucuronosyl/UDP-glucosyltransferase, UDP-glycosyltransferase family [Helianthus annuus]